MTEHAGRLLRETLAEHVDDIDAWTIAVPQDVWLGDFDLALGELLPDEPDPWRALPALTGGVSPSVSHTFERNGPTTLLRSGLVLLEEYDLAIARWCWFEPEYGNGETLFALAVRSDGSGTPAGYNRFRDRLTELRRRRNRDKWQVVDGARTGETFPRLDATVAADRLIADDALLKRVRREAKALFSASGTDLYQKLGLAPKRGILLHGPPGNGKTSLIRLLAAELPNVAALLLKPASDFDSDDVERVFRHWREQGPAMLVIEDLDWLLKRLDVSRFLNTLDGVEQDTGAKPGEPAKPLLLVATTNHPDELDPALSNRPGRFDAVIEIPNPSPELRKRFFDKHLPELSDDALAKDTAELSFAHLHEIVRLAGLLALEAGREERTADDVAEALALTKGTSENASRGFAGKPEQPFGLHPRGGKLGGGAAGGEEDIPF
ncbi:MAG: AAA family ATPase [Planctomycetota bacterium]